MAGTKSSVQEHQEPIDITAQLAEETADTGSDSDPNSVSNLLVVLEFVFGYIFHVAVMAIVYHLLSPVGVLSPGDALGYVVLNGFPPLMILQWMLNEFVSAANVFAEDHPFNSTAHFHPGALPTWRVLFQRFATNNTEQTLMTMCTVMHLTQSLASGDPLDARLAVAWALAFVCGRMIYFVGYSSKTPSLRIAGLIAGGFWFNLSAAWYSAFIACGMTPSWGAIITFYVLSPLLCVPAAFGIVKIVKENRKSVVN